MIKRIFVEDGWNLAHAIKQREENSLLDRFQCYWLERCGNDDFLSQSHVLSILMDFAMDNFERAEWYEYKQYFRLHNLIKDNGSITVLEMINAYLVAIELMQMYFEEE
jgi:hypothetical protein